MKKSLLFVFVLFLAALTLAGCGGSKKATLDVEMNDFSYIPNKFEMPAGGEITLNMKNTGKLEHEFVIIKKGEQVTVPFNEDDESKVFWEAEVNAGASQTVTFTAPPDPGEYQVVCGTPGHIEQGMVASLTVK